MKQWSAREMAELADIRSRVASELKDCPIFPEVVGDRRILRFIRGEGHNLDVVEVKYRNFLRWRKAMNIDAIRQNIVYGGMDCPTKFPLGEKILSLLPQIIILPDARDKLRRPIIVERYSFSPREVLKQITFEQYMEFFLYTLEYRTLVMEQVCAMEERRLLAEAGDRPPIRQENGLSDEGGYGVILNTCVIRDMKVEKTMYMYVHVDVWS